MQTSHSREVFRFGDFELDVDAYELRRQGRPVKLGRQSMDVLILLVENRQRLVSRADIVERLWGKDVFVDVETGVNTAISKIRQALRDSPEDSAFVETVPAKGYRFVAAVEVVSKPHDATRHAVLQERPDVRPTSGAEPIVPIAPVGDGEGERRPFALVVLVAAGLLAAVAAWAWLRPDRGASGAILAVLPVANLTGDADREYLAEGLAEETIASLGQIDPERLSVVGRTSMMAYKNTTKSLAEIGRELGTDYLVESTIRAEGGRLRITSKLIRVADQIQLWSDSYDREPTSMLGLQQEISLAIAEQIRLRLSPDRQNAIARRQTRNPDAYDLYLRGQNFANQRTPPTTQRAIEYFHRATALDPDYALAWSGLSMAYAASPLNSDTAALEAFPPAWDAARQAVRADPNLAEAQYALGYLNWASEWNWPVAEAAFRRAIDLDSQYAAAHLTLGHALSQMGRHTEAEPLMRRARELEPLDAMAHAISSQVAFQARDYRRADEYAGLAIGLDREFWIGHMMRAQAYEQLGRNDLALEAATIGARFSGNNSKTLSLRGYLLAKMGRTNEAREVLTAMEAASRHRYISPFTLALVHAGVGERDAVFEQLDRAYAARDVHLMFLTVDPKWDSYRRDPRFIALLERCGFMRTSAPSTD